MVEFLLFWRTFFTMGKSGFTYTRGLILHLEEIGSYAVIWLELMQNICSFCFAPVNFLSFRKFSLKEMKSYRKYFSNFLTLRVFMKLLEGLREKPSEILIIIDDVLPGSSVL